MKRIIVELEEPIYRYSIIDGEIVVDKFTKYYLNTFRTEREGELPVEAFDDNMVKRVSLPTKYRDRVFDKFTPQGGCMLSYNPDKKEEFVKQATEYYNGQLKKQEAALQAIKDKINVLNCL